MKSRHKLYKLLCFLFLVIIMLCNTKALHIYADESTQEYAISEVGQAPSDSIIIHTPFSFYQSFRSIVITVVIIFTLLIVFIIILAIYLRKISGMKSELQNKHKELIQSDNKLRQQFNELISMQKMLSSSEKRYSLLFEKMLNAFCVLEPVVSESGKLIDVRFVDINPGFRAQIDVEAADIVGKTWMEVYKYPNKNLKIYDDILCTNEAKHFDTYYPKTDIYYSANAFKISVNQIGVVFNNITEYKQVIKEITVLKDELE